MFKTIPEQAGNNKLISPFLSLCLSSARGLLNERCIWPTQAEGSGNEPVAAECARLQGLALEGQTPVSFPPNLSPQLPNLRLVEDQIPSCVWSSSRPAKPDRLSLPDCSLTLTRTHTEHNSWEPRECSCWLHSKEASEFIALSWQQCRRG